MAGSDVAYKNLTPDQKSKGEFQFLQSALSDMPHGIHQGIYLLTPSGKAITKINWGWPTPDTQKMNDQLSQGIAKYKSMRKTDKLSNSPLKESDRSMPKKHFIKAPKNWLQLRNTSRSYSFDDMELFDIRHPVYNKIDKLWYTENEKLSFVPSQLTKGYSEKVDIAPLQRLLINSHLILSSAAWWKDHTKQADMSMSVEATKGSKVIIHYQGNFSQDADSKWNKTKFKGKVLGKAVWNKDSKKFESFTWAGLGTHSLQTLRSNMHKGSTKAVAIASVLTLDPKYKSEHDLTPHHWSNGYPRELKLKVE